MLLESPLWWKEGYVLKWEARGLYSERVTEFTDTDCDNPSPLNEFAETLRVSDIQSSRSLFLLRPLAHPTAETESSSLPLMLTPSGTQIEEEPEAMQARKEKNGYRNGTRYPNLISQIKYDPRFQGLMRTPSAMDFKSWENSKYTGGGTLAQEVMQNPKYNGMLPTPRGNNVTEVAMTESLASRNKHNLEEEVAKMVVNGTLPTPSARDWKPPYNEDAMVRKDGMTRDDMLSSLPTMLGLKERGGCTFQLSPLFTQEMMGFPFGWTEWPFLSQSGAPNPSKPTVTP